MEDMDAMDLLYKLATKMEEKGFLYRVEEKHYIDHRKAKTLDEVLKANGIYGDMEIKVEHINFYVKNMSYRQQCELDSILKWQGFYREKTELLREDKFTERFDAKIIIRTDD